MSIGINNREKKRIAVFASGGGTNFQAIIDGCENGTINGEIVLLIYNRKDAFAKERAEKHGIKSCYVNKRQFENEQLMVDKMLELLDESGTQLIVLAGYLQKIDARIVEKYKNAIVNIHPSLIPAFCGDGFYGHFVHEAALRYGVKVSGCTVHFVDSGMDTGPIIMQTPVIVEQGDTAETLAARILPYEHKTLTSAVALICDDKVTVEDRKVIIRK